MRRSLVWLIILGVICGCSQGDIPYRKSSLLMGTVARIEIRDNPEKKLSDNAMLAAFKRMRHLAKTLDYHSETSEISKINALEGRNSVQVSRDTFKVIKYARSVYKETDGAFDITVAPLSELWGFRKKGQRARSIPKEKEIDSAIRNVGADKILLNDQTDSVGFAVRGMKIDLSGIAKGYIVDEAAGTLEKMGIGNFLVEAGGDIRCIGGTGDKPWRIGIQDPSKKNRIIGTIELADAAVTTSGSYENFITIKGERFSHIINPKTGYPVKNSIQSVTVIAPTCMEADAMATAVFVLGEKKGLELVERLKGFDCVIITGVGSDFKIIVSENIENKIKLL